MRDILLLHYFLTEKKWEKNQCPIVVDVRLLSHVQLFVTLWTAACKAPLSFTLSQGLLRFMSTESVTLSNHLILCHPLLLCLYSFPASGSFPVNWLFASCGQSIETSVSVLLVNIQGWFPSELTGFISLQSKGLTESSLTLQLESMNSLVLSLLYGPAVTSGDYWKNHSFD